MATEGQLKKVKQIMLISGDHQDESLKLYIDEVINFLFDAGVSQDFLDSNDATGLIARGVIDLWDYGAGGAKLSPYFVHRAIQASAGEY